MPVRPLSKELQELAIKELNEDPKRIEADLAHIKEWLSKQPHINARKDDQLLLAFLRGCKFSLERTKEKLDMYYTLRTIAPEFYDNRDPLDPEIQKVLSAGSFLPLSKLPSPTSPRICLMRGGMAEKHKYDQVAEFKVNTMIQEIMLLEDDNMNIAGVTGLQDLSGVTMSFVLSLPISLIKKATTCFFKGYPIRYKGSYFFNISSVFETINKMFVPLLPEKFRKRMKIYSSLEEMCKEFSQEVLPEEYGGKGGKIDDIAAHWKAKVESYREWFLEDAQYKTDEKKRPGKPKTTESVFGLEGSFRQLSVD